MPEIIDPLERAVTRCVPRGFKGRRWGRENQRRGSLWYERRQNFSAVCLNAPIYSLSVPPRARGEFRLHHLGTRTVCRSRIARVTRSKLARGVTPDARSRLRGIGP